MVTACLAKEQLVCVPRPPLFSANLPPKTVGTHFVGPDSLRSSVRLLSQIPTFFFSFVSNYFSGLKQQK